VQQNFPNPKAKRKNSSSLPSSSLKTRLLKDKEKKKRARRTTGEEEEYTTVAARTLDSNPDPQALTLIPPEAESREKNVQTIV
jgi:hypothetical protein